MFASGSVFGREAAVLEGEVGLPRREAAEEDPVAVPGFEVEGKGAAAGPGGAGIVGGAIRQGAHLLHSSREMQNEELKKGFGVMFRYPMDVLNGGILKSHFIAAQPL